MDTHSPLKTVSIVQPRIFALRGSVVKAKVFRTDAPRNASVFSMGSEKEIPPVAVAVNLNQISEKKRFGDNFSSRGSVSRPDKLN